jgi:hypothetical protein
MNWITIYIKGKGDFQEEVRRKLEHSDLRPMPGNIGSSGDSSYLYDLYWIKEKTDLRDFKRVIGARIIWKYRLEFYNSLEAFIESEHTQKETNFTVEEQDRINTIREQAKEW